MKQTTVINLWGGSGCGKSTLAALVYAELKMQHKSVELVREYCKTWAWEGRPIRDEDELYIFMKQLRAESHLYGKVDWIVTDRPLGLSAVYDKFFRRNTAIEEIWRGILAEQLRKGIKHIDLMVSRAHPYTQAGRNQTEEEAHQVDLICNEVMSGMPLVSTPAQVLSVINGDDEWVCTCCAEKITGASVTLGGGGPFCLPCGQKVDAALRDGSGPSDEQPVFSDS